MSQIQKAHNVEMLPVSLQDFAKARLETPIKNMNDNQVKKAIVDILTKASFDAGTKMGEDAQILKFQVEACFGEITGKYRDLTISELKEAFRRGVRGEFGPYFGFCAKTYHEWIKAYYNLPERAKAQQEYLALIEAQSKVSEKPLHLKINESKQGCINAFNEYKNTGRLPLCSFAYYDVLVGFIGTEYNGIKTLITDQEARKSITKEQTDKFRNRYLEQKAKSEKKEYLLEAEAIMAKISNLDKDGELHRRIKEAFLKHYFDGLIKNKTDLEI